MRVTAMGAPDHYAALLAPLPDGVTFTTRAAKRSRFVHLFATSRTELARQLSKLRTGIEENGVVWVSWPKKASGVATDITENVIRELALPLGFVDVKVCAVDDTWSGLKLMIRRSERNNA